MESLSRLDSIITIASEFLGANFKLDNEALISAAETIAEELESSISDSPDFYTQAFAGAMSGALTMMVEIREELESNIDIPSISFSDVVEYFNSSARNAKMDAIFNLAMPLVLVESMKDIELAEVIPYTLFFAISEMDTNDLYDNMMRIIVLGFTLGAAELELIDIDWADFYAAEMELETRVLIVRSQVRHTLKNKINKS